MKTPEADSIPKVGDEYREEARKRVIAAALEVFAKSGYHDAKMDEIAERAAVSKGTLYNQFSSKEDMFRGVAEHLLKQEEDTYGVLLDDADPVEAFKLLYSGIEAIFEGKMGLMFEVYSIAYRDQRMRDIISESMSAEVSGFAQVIAFMQARGKIRRDVDPETFATMLMTAFMGHFICSRLPVEAFDREKLLDVILRSLLFEGGSPSKE